MSSHRSFGRVPIPPHMQKLPRDERGYPVPYVARWTSERDVITPPPWHERWGAIAASTGARFEGEPDLGHMEPGRQRECMVHPFCQVCHRNLQGKRIYVAGSYELITGQTGRMMSEPPACAPCMAFAVQVCPGLLRARPEGLAVARVHQRRLFQARLMVNEDGAPRERYFDIDFMPPFERHSVLGFIEAMITEGHVYDPEQFLAAYRKGTL